MLLSHYPMVQHKTIKTWCTANPAQFPVTHICSIITSSLTKFTSSYHFHPQNFVNLYFCQASSHHPSLNSIHHIIYFHPQSFVNLYFCQFNKHTKVFQFFTNFLYLFSFSTLLQRTNRHFIYKLKFCTIDKRLLAQTSIPHYQSWGVTPQPKRIKGPVVGTPCSI